MITSLVVPALGVKKIDRESALSHSHGHMNTEMEDLFPSATRRRLVFTFAFLAMALSGFAAEPSSEDDDTNADPSAPRFISPDGKYGLLVSQDSEGGDRVDLVEVATRRSLVKLSDPERPERPNEARLDWSKDSQLVAAYTATRVDGFTTIFAREGDGFVEVKLPDLPDLPDPEGDAAFRKKHHFKFLKWANTGSRKFVRWLKSGVELKLYNEVVTEDAGIFSSEIDVRIDIDSKHHATVKKVTRKEGFED